MKRLAAIGECMLELRHRDATLLELGFAGDSFNTALYLARLNPPQRLAVDYVTALDDMQAFAPGFEFGWIANEHGHFVSQGEGLGHQMPTDTPGRAEDQNLHSST